MLACDFGLDLRGTPGRRRRNLRRELRSNLREAALRTGGREAVAALGSIRQMAADAGVDDPTRPRWHVGTWTGAAALAICVHLGFFAAFVPAARPWRLLRRRRELTVQTSTRPPVRQ